MQSVSATRGSQFYSWGARALFIGPSLNLEAHRNAVAVVAVGLDAKFEVAIDSKKPQRGAYRVRAALIPPNTLHKLTSKRGRMAFIYVDAASRDFESLTAAVGLHTRRAGFQLRIERPLIALLRALADGADAANTERKLRQLVFDVAPLENNRLVSAIDYLHKHIADKPRIEELAKRVHLSPSRFRHAFKEFTGVSFRRYRVWAAMSHAMRNVVRGKSLTDAAYAAGFSSSAHFSFAFKQMFGLAPSQLVKSSRYCSVEAAL
jgi:AraC-like DNA-binding protein